MSTAKFNQGKIDNEEDPLIVMLNKTGCIDLHYKVQVRKVDNSIRSIFNRNYEILRSASPKLKIGESVKILLWNLKLA